jgi:hypothetical protein
MMEMKQVNKKIKEQQDIIQKAEEQVEIYLEMRGLLYRLNEITTGKKVAAKAPVVKKAKKKKKKKVAKAAIKDSPKKKPSIVMPFVYEAMGYMSQNFTSADLLEISYNRMQAEKAPITFKQAKSAVHGYLYGASRGKVKSNPHPLVYTGKKNKQRQRIYQRTVVASKGN